MAPHPYPNMFISNFVDYFQNNNMYPGIIYTLVFIKNNNDILLGLKKRGLGQDKWNGFGGKVEKNETILQGAIRETKEECNLNVTNMNHIGIIAYEEETRLSVDFVHVFTANTYTDVIKESDEMKPKWFNINDIPYEKMWPDAKFWLPIMLNDKCFFARVCYDNEHMYKCSHINEVQSLDYVLGAVKKLYPSMF